MGTDKIDLRLDDQKVLYRRRDDLTSPTGKLTETGELGHTAWKTTLLVTDELERRYIKKVVPFASVSAGPWTVLARHGGEDAMVNIYKVASRGESVAVIQALVEGPTLDKAMKVQGAMTESAAIKLLLPLARTLSALELDGVCLDDIDFSAVRMTSMGPVICGSSPNPISSEGKEAHGQFLQRVASLVLTGDEAVPEKATFASDGSPLSDSMKRLIEGSFTSADAVRDLLEGESDASVNRPGDKDVVQKPSIRSTAAPMVSEVSGPSKKNRRGWVVAACIGLLAVAIVGVVAATSSSRSANALDSVAQEQADGTAEPNLQSGDIESAPTTVSGISMSNVDEKNFDFSITGFHVAEGFDGTRVFLIDWTFTNKSNDTTACSLTVYPRAFQDGVELNLGTPADMDSKTGNGSRNVRPNASIEGSYCWIIKSDSPVEVEVYEAKTGLLKDPLIEEMFDLK